MQRKFKKKKRKKKVVIFTVRQYSTALLKDDSYRKSFIICRKCLFLTTLAERRNGSSCWPQPISYIIICLQDLLAKLGCFSSIKCNGIPQGFTRLSFIIEGDMAMGKWAGIFSRVFVCAQRDSTRRAEMIGTGC